MSSENTEANRAKEDGSNAWSRGDYNAAIQYFSDAIHAAKSTEKEFLRVLHSNRSAAYLKANKNDRALDDAIKCVELDPQWAKGHTRKGDAYYALKQYTQVQKRKG